MANVANNGRGWNIDSSRIIVGWENKKTQSHWKSETKWKQNGDYWLLRITFEHFFLQLSTVKNHIWTFLSAIINCQESHLNISFCNYQLSRITFKCFLLQLTIKNHIWTFLSTYLIVSIIRNQHYSTITVNHFLEK